MKCARFVHFLGGGLLAPEKGEKMKKDFGRFWEMIAGIGK